LPQSEEDKTEEMDSTIREQNEAKGSTEEKEKKDVEMGLNELEEEK